MRRLVDAVVQAVKGMLRNGLVTAVCIFVLVSCLVFAGSFSLISQNIDYNLGKITGLNEIAVFIDNRFTLEEARAIEKEVRELENVKDTVFTTRDEGLKEVEEDYEGWEDVLSNLTPEENPLSHRIIITYLDHARAETLVLTLKNEMVHKCAAEDGTEIKCFTTVNSRTDIAASANSLQRGISVVFVCFALLCTVVCTFVVLNTIKLSVYSRKDEITIMRYIGAGRGYIAAPFVMEGIFIGIIGAVSAFAIEKIIYSTLTEFVTTQMTFVEMLEFSKVTPTLLLMFFGISMFTGIVGSIISLGKYVEA